MDIFSAIFIVIGLSLVVFGIILVLIDSEYANKVIITGLSFYAVGIIILCFYFALNTPTKDDVLKGKAIYQETLHITDNDTIRTYQIVWKDEHK